MYRKLSGDGVRVPNGFAITAEAYRHVLEAAGAVERAAHAPSTSSTPTDMDDLARRAKQAREIVYGAGIPGGPGRRDPCRLPRTCGTSTATK